MKSLNRFPLKVCFCISTLVANFPIVSSRHPLMPKAFASTETTADKLSSLLGSYEGRMQGFFHSAPCALTLRPGDKEGTFSAKLDLTPRNTNHAVHDEFYDIRPEQFELRADENALEMNRDNGRTERLSLRLDRDGNLDSFYSFRSEAFLLTAEIDCRNLKKID